MSHALHAALVHTAQDEIIRNARRAPLLRALRNRRSARRAARRGHLRRSGERISPSGRRELLAPGDVTPSGRRELLPPGDVTPSGRRELLPPGDVTAVR